MMSRYALVAIASIGLAWAVSAESVFGSNDYVEAVVPAAPAPILLTVPHGGSLLPASIPDRTAGCGSPCLYGTCQPGEADDVNCPASTLKDLMTSEFASALADALESTFGTRPGVVFNHLHRSKLDPNREKGEAAQGNTDAETAYDEYFAFADDAVASMIAHCGLGLVIDIHGHAHPEGMIELGYLVSGNNLALGSSEINSLDSASTSFASLLHDPRTTAGRTLANIVHGANSLGTHISASGYTTVPSSATLHPGEASYFSGGFTTSKYGLQLDGVDAVQLELPASIRADQQSVDSAASDIAAALGSFFETMYAIDISSGVGCPNVAPAMCDLDGPSNAYFFKGYVWDTSCSVALHGSCAIDDASGMQMMYKSVRLYRRLATKQANMQKQSAACSSPAV